MVEEDIQEKEKDTKWTKILKKMNADDEDTDNENHDADNTIKNEEDMVSQNVSKTGTGDGLSTTDRMSMSLAISMQWMDRNGVTKEFHEAMQKLALKILL